MKKASERGTVHRRTAVGKSRLLSGLRSDGTEFPISLVLSRFDDPVSGEILYSGFVTDLTEQVISKLSFMFNY